MKKSFAEKARFYALSPEDQLRKSIDDYNQTIPNNKVTFLPPHSQHSTHEDTDRNLETPKSRR